jgi:hypothetical protein
MKTPKATKAAKANDESLIKAQQTANLLVSDLRTAYGKSDAVVEIVLFPLLEQTVKIEQALKTLNRAVTRSDSDEG